MDDVLIVGAGPAGAVAAVVLARAGARVRIVDRSKFPRPKLCGDTVNPGTLAALARLGLSDEVEERGSRVDGMIVTGENGVAIEGRYPGALHGRALVRYDFDWALLQHAMAAGAAFEPGTTARQALVVETRQHRTVTGVILKTTTGERLIRARVVIAAEGRRSSIAFGFGLARHPRRPRRWAIGGYYEGVAHDQPALGEMHVRRGRYIGVASTPGGLTNVCLVKPSGPADRSFRDPADLLRCELARDPMLADRFARARSVTEPVVLGPLAVDVSGAGIDGLLLAGDAAGFVDPMTGDGLRFAVRGGEFAAIAALEALEQGWRGVHTRLAARRRRAFAGKRRFNLALRALVASPGAITASALAARVMPDLLRAIIAHAGDCHPPD